jgi:glucose-1-phosphate thymidylyltransferase
MGVQDVALVVGYRGEKLQELVGDGSDWGVNVSYVWQRKQLGTGHAAMLCEDFVGGDDFVLIFGDILTRYDNYGRMAELYRGGTCDAVLTVFPVEDPSGGAAVDVEDGLVTRIVEKPKPGTVLNAYNNAGMFIWPAEMFDRIRDLELSQRGEYEFTDGIISFLNDGRRLAAFELQGYWENLSDPESCIRMNQNLLVEYLPPEEDTQDRTAHIGPDCRVSQSKITAATRLGAGCRIEDSRLDHACEVGDNTNIRYAEIGAHAKIGEGCRIGPYVSIAEGAVIEDGASIGPNTTVGPGCVVGAESSLASTILLEGSRTGEYVSLVHTLLGYGRHVPSNEKLSGKPERAIELL